MEEMAKKSEQDQDQIQSLKDRIIAQEEARRQAEEDKMFAEYERQKAREKAEEEHKARKEAEELYEKQREEFEKKKKEVKENAEREANKQVQEQLAKMKAEMEQQVQEMEAARKKAEVDKAKYLAEMEKREKDAAEEFARRKNDLERKEKDKANMEAAELKAQFEREKEALRQQAEARIQSEKEAARQRNERMKREMDEQLKKRNQEPDNIKPDVKDPIISPQIKGRAKVKRPAPPPPNPTKEPQRITPTILKIKLNGDVKRFCSFLEGTYCLQKNRIQGYPTWKFNNYSIWIHSSSESCWWIIGVTEQLGHLKCWVSESEKHHQLPHQAYGWQFWDNTTWHAILDGDITITEGKV